MRRFAEAVGSVVGVVSGVVSGGVIGVFMGHHIFYNKNQIRDKLLLVLIFWSR